MTNVRELTKTVNGNEVIGQWCSEGGRRTNPEACNNAYATTFPSNAFAPGYFSTPPIYRAPNVREQRQRCVHNNLEGDAARCSMDSKQYQCAVRTSYNCSAAFANDIRRPPQDKWCAAMTPRSVCEASYARAGNPWSIGSMRGRNYRHCVWQEGQGCRLSNAGFNCRDPDSGTLCIDVRIVPGSALEPFSVLLNLSLSDRDLALLN